METETAALIVTIALVWFCYFLTEMAMEENRFKEQRKFLDNLKQKPMEELIESMTSTPKSPIRVIGGKWTVFGEKWDDMTQSEQNTLRMHINHHKERENLIN